MAAMGTPEQAMHAPEVKVRGPSQRLAWALWIVGTEEHMLAIGALGVLVEGASSLACSVREGRGPSPRDIGESWAPAYPLKRASTDSGTCSRANSAEQPSRFRCLRLAARARSSIGRRAFCRCLQGGSRQFAR